MYGVGCAPSLYCLILQRASLVIGWKSYLIAEEILEGHAEEVCEDAALSRACSELFGSCRLAIG
jgi:hypothetical protein